MFDEMSDRDLVAYVENHSTTERALFHRDMVKRFLLLAGADPDQWMHSTMEFVTMRYETIAGLLTEAWKRVAT